MTTTKRPWMKFYPADWRADQALRIVSLAARGLWIECMCIAHVAEPYGHLVVNGRPVTDAQLAALSGASADQIAELLAELEAAGVFSRTAKGAIYSRRMTRDLKMARTAQANGKTGGSPILWEHKQIGTRDIPPLKPPDKGPVKGGVKAQKPEVRSQKPESNQTAQPEQKAARDAALEVGLKVLDMLSEVVDTTIWPHGVVHQWLADGADPERHIYPAIKAAIADGKAKKARGLKYFWPAIEEAMERRQGAGSNGNGEADVAMSPLVHQALDLAADRLDRVEMVAIYRLNLADPAAAEQKAQAYMETA